ncbi:ABC transporter permease [Ornithinimicrobium faecis]|uniref:ABC transporter permease n=1 Tax=Ornithinimicrobium faecis TaxID=2934158 RepID=UPI00211952ED|nr:ABC transporter permease [Ornithinimicrobium sp. HY1745]
MGRQRGQPEVRLPGRVRALGLLLGRQFRRDPWVSVLLALVILVVSLLATAWPRMVLDMNTRQVPYVLSDLSELRRDVAATASVWAVPPLADESRVPGSGAEGWSLLADNLEELRAEQPEPLRSVLQPGGVYAELLRPLPTAPAPVGAAFGGLQLTLRVDPELPEQVDLVRGEWPEAMVNRDSLGGRSLLGVPASEELPSGDFELIQVALLDEAAQQLNWQVGDTWGAVLLTGTYQPRDPEDPRWGHAGNSASLGTISSQGSKIATAAGYLAPDSTAAVDTVPAELRVRAFLPLDATELRGDQVDEVLRQLQQLGSAQSVLLAEGEVGPVNQGVVVTLDTEALATLQGLLEQQQTTASVLAVLAAGPVGVTLAVLLLGARLIQARRASSVGLAVARGASSRQVHTVLGVEGMLIGVPASLVGYLAAGLMLPAQGVAVRDVAVVAVAGLTPATALLVTAGRGTVREVRRDLRSRTGSRWRAVVEVGLFALTGLAVWRLMTRGLVGVETEPEADGGEVGAATEALGGSSAGGSGGSVVQEAAGVDLLMAATPLLVALAACVITMRLYPLLVRMLLALVRRGRGIAGFLGVAGALRNPAAGVLPALSVILGVAVAVSSAILASTVIAGASAAVWETAGAQVRVSGPTMGLDERRALREVDGVAEVATAREIDRQTALSDGISADGVRVVVIDEEMQEVSADAGPLPALPPELFEVRQPAPVLTIGSLTEAEGTAHLRSFGSVEVVGHRATLPGVRTRGSTVVMSISNWESVRSNVSSGNAALVSLTGDVPADEVTDALASSVPTALVETPQLQEEEFRAAPVTSGLLAAFLLMVVVGSVLAALAILLAHHLDSRARARMLSVLRTLGMAPRQGRGLTAWELGPLVGIAMVVGAVTGALVSWVLVRTVDLTGLTGGAAQPELAVDGTLLALVLGAVAVTMVATITVSAILAARSDLAQQLRIGDEG